MFHCAYAIADQCVIGEFTPTPVPVAAFVITTVVPCHQALKNNLPFDQHDS